MILANGTVTRPYYDWGGRKYMEIRTDEGPVRFKVPFRYGRVMAHVEGIRPIQDIQSGEFVHVFFDRIQDVFVLKSLRVIDSPRRKEDNGSC
jgi:hypothetical protein